MDLGRYLLHEEIASGGMASVHIGRLRGAVGFARTVAIKRLHPPFARDPEFVSMLVDEARIASRVRHLNVVPILDVVCLEDEVFVVMEYVLGDCVARIMRGAPGHLPTGVAVAIALGVLHGLHAAHEAKSERGAPLSIVHRDVSPQNVLLGIDGVARLADFGVAKAALRVQSTRDGHVKGKLSYMAPEQLAGEKVDRRTDVYSVGVVLWEMLTGERLFASNLDISGSGRPPRDCVPDPSSLNSDVPHSLDAVVRCALSFDPADRFSTAQHMAEALERATPAATQHAVAQWLDTAAPASVARGRALVAAVEGAAESVKGVVSSTVVPVGVTASVMMGPGAHAPTRIEAMPSGQPLSSGLRDKRGDEGRTDGSRGRKRVELGTLLAFVVTATAFVSIRFAVGAHPVTVGDPVAPISAAPQRGVDLESPPALAPTTVKSAELVAAPRPAFSPPHRSAGSRLVRRARPVADPPPGETCSPPYTVGADGVRYPKRHCL